MKTNQFPYQGFEGVPAWTVIEEAIENLVQNGDLIEHTDRRHIVGFLIKRLNTKGMLTTQAVSKQARKERVQRGQEPRDGGQVTGSR